MKNILLLAFIALSYTINAQDIVITPNPVMEWETISETELLGDATFKNDSNVDKTYTWTRTVMCETGNLQNWFCDPVFCYIPSVSTQTFTLGAGEEGPFQLHATFASPEDRAITVQIRVVEVGNETNAVDMMYELNSCVISSTDDVEINEVKLFPNPTRDQFTLTNVGNIQDVIIHNIIGSPVKQYLAEEGANYSIGDLPVGVYMVQLIDANGNNIGSKRVFKQ